MKLEDFVVLLDVMGVRDACFALLGVIAGIVLGIGLTFIMQCN